MFAINFALPQAMGSDCILLNMKLEIQGCQLYYYYIIVLEMLI